MASMLQSFGNKNGPIIVCVPGLLGGAEDFRYLMDRFNEYFHFLVFDPNAERRQFGINGLTEKVMQEIQFDYNANEIFSELPNFTSDPVWMCGISLGGKIIYDFAIKFPQAFKGALLTDVSPGSFGDSELFQFIESLVANLNMNQLWPDLKKTLREVIPDDSLRSLVQSQIFYPEKKPPAAWKVGMANFRALLQRQSMDEQFNDMFKVDELLAKQGSIIHVLKATIMSAINQDSYELLKKLKSVHIHEIKNSTHFLQHSHRDWMLDLIFKLNSNESQSQSQSESQSQKPVL